MTSPQQTGPDRVADENSATSEMPAISLFGDFIDRVSVVNGTYMSLLLAVGTTPGKGDEERSVLVPFLELRLDGRAPDNEGERLYPKSDSADSPESGERSLFSRTMTLENVAYMIFDLANEFNGVSEQLATIGAGGMQLERVRVEKCREWLAEAQRSLAQSMANLG